MKLQQRNLPALAPAIARPTYNRAQVKTGIVHIGVGGFHRSHQAYYLNRLLEEHGATEWGICGVGLREADRNISTVLKQQDGLYTLVTQHPDGTDKHEVIGSIQAFLLAADGAEHIVDKMAHPDTRIVSLTITEGGYNFNASTGEFNFAHPDVQHELAKPDEPKTVYGFLTAALKKRRANGLPAFTVMSCDNIQHNGDVAKKMVLAFARTQDAGLADWIADEVCFPNTMVDRITPVTPPEVIERLRQEYDLEDGWPVVCEPFIQWVVEDKFSNGRPPLEALGVQFVADVTPYEKMKIRLLNAGHSVLGIPGAIHGHPTIDACMRDEVFAGFMRRFMDEEATPTLGTVAGIDLGQYKDSLEARFANPNIKDSVSRICSESSAKLPKFLLPTLLENLAAGRSIKYATFLLAAWCYYSDKQTSNAGVPLEVIDARAEELQQVASKTETDGLAFLRQTDMFGDLVENEAFCRGYAEAVRAIYTAKSIRELMAAV